MSTQVELFFREWPHPDLIQRGVNIRVVRLACKAVLWDGNAWIVQPDDAWIDTGSPLSVLPFSAWANLKPTVLATNVPLSIAGSNLYADVGEVYLAVRGGNGIASSPLRVRAFLSPSDDLPILLGMEDFLTRCALHCDHASKIAFLEFT